MNTGLQSEIDKAKKMHADKERDLREQINMMATKSGEDAEWKLKHNELLQENGRLEQENQDLFQQHERLDQESQNTFQRNERLEQENRDLQQDSQELQQELLEQQRVTDEVRKEAAGFLADMKALAQQSSGSVEREEKLTQQIQSLEDQVAMWKARLAQSKADSRSRAIELAVRQPNVEKDETLVHSGGIIKDIHVIEYQLAIDEAIRVSRQDPKGLLNQMKAVVLTVKHITEDFARVDESDAKIAQLLTKISGTACNFITATKNYVFSGGLSPVSLLDAAASHLSSAIVEAVHQVKMYSAQDAPRDSTSEAAPRPSGTYSTADRSSVSESVYSQSTIAAPPAAQPQSAVSSRTPVTNGITIPTTNGIGNTTFNPPTPAYSSEIQATELARLKVSPTLLSNPFTPSAAQKLPANITWLQLFLEDQSSTIVETIQHLVSAIRSSAEPPAVRADISAINTAVTSILRATQTAIDSAPAGSPLRDIVGPAVKSLSTSKAKLLEAEDEGWGMEDYATWKEIANGLPPIAFELARQVRDLSGKVEGLAGGGQKGGEEDFS